MLGSFFYVFQDCLICVWEGWILVVIAELCIYANIDCSCIWREVSGYKIKESRFTRTVIAKNTDFLSFGKNIRKVFYYRFRKTFADVVKLKDFSTKSFAFYFEGKAFVCLKFLAVDKLFVALYS